MEILDQSSWLDQGYICIGCNRAWSDLVECFKHVQGCDKAKLIGQEKGIVITVDEAEPILQKNVETEKLIKRLVEKAKRRGIIELGVQKLL